LRKLIHIPSIHKPIEGLGISDPQDKELARKVFEENRSMLEDFDADFSRVRVYLDNVADGEQLYTQMRILNGSKQSYENFLAGILVSQGATIEATEDATVISEARDAYEAWKESIRNGIAYDAESFNALLDTMIERRDESIAKKISGSLRDGEIGVLIIGVAHKAHLMLEPDIEVITQNSELIKELESRTAEGVAHFRQRGAEKTG